MRKGRCSKIIDSAGDFGGHFINKFHTAGGISDKDDGFGCVGHNGFELVHVGGGGRDVLDGSHGHDPVDVGHGVGHLGSDGDIGDTGGVNFAAQRIPGLRTGGGSAVVALTAFYFHGPFTFPVVDCPAFGRGTETFGDDVFRYFNNLVVDPSARLLQHFAGAFVVNPETDLGHDFKSRAPDFCDLVVAEHAK